MSAALDGDFHRYAWAPQPGPQEALLSCPADEIFFGGSRGGGKTAGACGLWLDHVGHYGANAVGLFVRRRFRDLEAANLQMRKFFTPLGAYYKSQSATWHFPNGAILRLRYLWDERDADIFQGSEFTFICVEEAGQYPTSKPIDMLRATLRSAAGVKTILLLTGNPGGAGHGWLKARFITPARRGFKLIKDDLGQTRCFIPSKLQDNPILLQSDPLYARRLAQVGSPQLVKAWLEGNWDIVVGGFFDDIWNAERHVLRPFRIPDTWKYRRGFDWGSSAPACLLIAAIADGTQVEGRPYFPKGSLILTRELYTVRRDELGEAQANEGLEWDNVKLGEAIAFTSHGLRFEDSVADPSIWIRQGGESIHDQMRKAALRVGGIWDFVKADNSRIPGWGRMRTMLANAARGRAEAPGLWVFETCRDFVRTVPILQRDPKKPDDVETDGTEDHAADAARYLIQARTAMQTAAVMPIRV